MSREDAREIIKQEIEVLKKQLKDKKYILWCLFTDEEQEEQRIQKMYDEYEREQKDHYNILSMKKPDRW